MIISFGDPATEDLFHRRQTRCVRQFPPDITRTALRKLDVMNMAHQLEDLRSPPANRLKVLKGALKGLHSIRVNDQWRITFRWVDGNVHDVLLTDYHS
jgi:proteic killer suppression protein